MSHDWVLISLYVQSSCTLHSHKFLDNAIVVTKGLFVQTVDKLTMPFQLGLHKIRQSFHRILMKEKQHPENTAIQNKIARYDILLHFITNIFLKDNKQEAKYTWFVEGNWHRNLSSMFSLQTEFPHLEIT